MSAELEARLKASLAAYAGLVEEPPAGEDVVLPVGRRRTPIRGWRAPLLVAAAVAAAGTVTVTAWPGTLGTSDSSSSDVEPATGGAGSAAAQERADEDAAVTATDAAQLEIGVPAPFDLYTHCGVLGADLGGIWFAADPPLVEGAGNPPAGWGNPYQPGTMLLLTPDAAVFRDDAGHELLLRADPDARPPACD